MPPPCFEPPDCERVRLAEGALLVVRDDRRADPNARYGGNKSRKFQRIVRDLAPPVDELCSVGAIGSHQVLATAIFAAEHDLRARCFVVAQPDVPSAHRNVARALALGAQLIPCANEAEAALRLAWARRRRETLVVPVGGSSLPGSLAYVEAARVLEAHEVRDLVVTLGSGGTAAGLAVGLTLARSPITVHAVATATPLPIVRGLLSSMVLRLLAHHGALALAPAAFARLRVIADQLGAGYAHVTAASERARRDAAAIGLTLDPVYTAKAFAHAQTLLAAGRTQVGFWHTYSTVDMRWIDERVTHEVPAALHALWRPLH